MQVPSDVESGTATRSPSRDPRLGMESSAQDVDQRGAQDDPANPRGGKAHVRERRKRQVLRRGSAYSNELRNFDLLYKRSASSMSLDDDPSAAAPAVIPEEWRAHLISGMQMFDFADAELVRHLDRIIGHLERRDLEAGDVLVHEGDDANHVFIVVDGELDVEVNGVFQATLRPGTLLGELGVLMDSKRTSTVHARAPCVVYALEKSTFLQLQAAASAHSLVQRSLYLRHAGVLRRVTPVNITKIASLMETARFEPGQLILEAGMDTNHLYLIEDGEVEVTVEETGLQKEAFNNQLVIEEPPSSAKISRRISLTFGPGATPQSPSDTEEEPERACLRFTARENEASEILLPGTLIGQAVIMIGAFHGKQAVGAWATVPGKPLFARSPATFRARTAVTCGRISSRTILEGVGALHDLLTGSKIRIKKRHSVEMHRSTVSFDDENLSLRSFRNLGMLGKGSFGIVSLMQLAEGDDKSYYACKAIAKVKASEAGQVEHLRNEAKILRSIDHSMVLRLYTIFQDENTIYFITDALPSIELWSLIYEDNQGMGTVTNGLPLQSSVFYAANICEVFCYLHANGIAYRDLKPENLMVDSKGYLVLIDFGFAKEVPWTSVGEDGSDVYHARTYTMCGTPEYIAPELILNQGHDCSVDLWAMGCLFFEIFMGHTPFQTPDGSAEYSDIFTGILSSKHQALRFPRKFARAGAEDFSRLIENLMRFEPHNRIGNRARAYADIFEAPVFERINFDKLRKREVPAPWLPAEFMPKPMPEHESETYTGSQEIFLDF